MERNHRVFLDQLRNRLSASVPDLSPNPRLRRYLYGTLFLLTAVTLGFSSSHAIQRQALENWLASNPPEPGIWKAAAQSRGLAQVRPDYALEKWSRLMPRDLTANAAWWDPVREALWIIAPSGSSSEVLLYAAHATPPRTASPPALDGLTPLGRGWTAYNAFQRLKIAPAQRSREQQPIPARADPKRWDF